MLYYPGFFPNQISFFTRNSCLVIWVWANFHADHLKKREKEDDRVKAEEVEDIRGK